MSSIDEALADLRQLLAGIHPNVLSATCDELDAAGWGDLPRAKIPADWREHPLARNPKGGRRSLYRTPEERTEAARGWRKKYDDKRRGGPKIQHQTKQARDWTAYRARLKAARLPPIGTVSTENVSK